MRKARRFSSLLAVSIGLVAIAPPISQPIQAQTQDSQHQELETLQKQALLLHTARETYWRDRHITTTSDPGAAT